MGQTAEVKRTWFDEIFSKIDYEDALAANVKLMSFTIENWNRDRIPFIIWKLAADISHKRQQTKIRREAEIRRKSKHYSPFHDGAFRKLRAKMEAWKEVHDEDTCGLKLIRKFSDEIFSDLPEDDEEDSRRYSCLMCLDTGLLSYRDDDDGKSYCGHCRCTKGYEVRDNFSDNGRLLGPGPR